MTEQNGQSTSGGAFVHTSMNEFMQMMQDTIRNTQEDLRRELVGITRSVANLSVAVRSLESNPPQGTDDTRHSNQDVHNNGGSPIRNSHYASSPLTNTIKLKDWNINYDGSNSMSDFIFKNETLKTRTQCSEEHLLANFHIFLSGKADN